MKFFATAVAIVSVFPAVFSQQLTVNTVAQVIECQPTQFSWTGGVAPYFLSLIPAGQPSAAAIKQFPTQTGNSYTWLVDLPAGTAFSISLKDSTGTTAYSDSENIQSGSDTSCVNTAVTEGGSSTGAASGAATAAAGATSPVATSAATTAAAAGTSAPAAASASAAAGTTKAAVTSVASAASSAKSSAGSATPSGTSSQANAASRGSSMSAFGVAGLMGLIGAALF